MNKCEYCGGQMDETAKFCPECGEKVKIELTVDEKLDKIMELLGGAIKREIEKNMLIIPKHKPETAKGKARRTTQEVNKDVETVVNYMIKNKTLNISNSCKELGIILPNTRRNQVKKMVWEKQRILSGNDKHVIRMKVLGNHLKEAHLKGMNKSQALKYAYAKATEEIAKGVKHQEPMIRKHAVTPPKGEAAQAIAQLHKYDKNVIPEKINGITNKEQIKSIMSMMFNLSANKESSIKYGDLEMIGITSDKYNDVLAGILKETPAICSYLGIVDRFKLKFNGSVMTLVYG